MNRRVGICNSRIVDECEGHRHVSGVRLGLGCDGGALCVGIGNAAKLKWVVRRVPLLTTKWTFIFRYELITSHFDIKLLY